jgi:hypothetical protein
MSEQECNFVTCCCEHCAGGIEFDANLLTPESCIVPCPHCGEDTRLFVNAVPSPPPPAALSGSSHITPKQLAFLTYMGVPDADKLTKREASELIDSGGFFPEVTSMAQWDRQARRKAAWDTERLFLYPDLYAQELDWHLNNTLPHALHRCVRGLYVSSSERLTRAKILRVIRTLTAENRGWWHGKGHEDVFMERLKQVYPRCCDGQG